MSKLNPTSAKESATNKENATTASGSMHGSSMAVSGEEASSNAAVVSHQGNTNGVNAPTIVGGYSIGGTGVSSNQIIIHVCDENKKRT